MPKHNVNSWKDCKNSSNVEKIAEQNGVKIRYTKGSHFIMQKDGKTMTGYHGEISNGVAVKIFKFFRDIGIVSILILGLDFLFHIFGFFS